ncbi:acetyl-CoA acetyltransferase [Mycobacteroides chelonae]|nr:acetyl-CoA acetyltransferase [Mycobacteroides chelonae]
MSLSNACAIAGIGQTEYTRGTQASTLELQLDASLAAIADAGLSVDDIDAVMPNHMSGRILEEFIVNLGLEDIGYSSTVHTGGASVISAIQSACLAIHGGIASCVLVVAGRRGYSEQRVSRSRVPTTPVMAAVEEFEKPYGSIVAAQWFAQAAQRHMYEYGTRVEHFAEVALTCRRHANLNPAAYMYTKTMEMSDYLESRLITTPFRLFDCSLETDGAGAVVVTAAQHAADLPHPVTLVSGIGEGHGSPPTSVTQKKEFTLIEGVARAGQRAFAMAGMTPKDIDCAQLYDAFTWFVLGSLEALGFCGPGESGPFVADGGIGLGGAMPVNTHGGLLSEAHVSGINHVIEAVRQLRRTVEPDRQVPNCHTVLVSNEGDFHEGSVLILQRGVL